jgi:hypothetical protein
MFEKASKIKLRFDYRGVCTVEDLWDLSVKELDSIYKTVNAKLKQSQEDSLLNTKTKEDETLKLQVDILKHIVEVKLAEAEAKEQAKERKMKKQKLTEILASKQDADLQGKSVEEIKKMIEELGE